LTLRIEFRLAGEGSDARHHCRGDEDCTERCHPLVGIGKRKHDVLLSKKLVNQSLLQDINLWFLYCSVDRLKFPTLERHSLATKRTIRAAERTRNG
jgi:hypothetical protein